MPSYYPYFADEEAEAERGDIITRNHTVKEVFLKYYTTLLLTVTY